MHACSSDSRAGWKLRVGRSFPALGRWLLMARFSFLSTGHIMHVRDSHNLTHAIASTLAICRSWQLS